MANEKRLIYADMLLGIVNEIPDRNMNGVTIAVAIAQCPTVDAMEVVHGAWENEQFGLMYYDAVCSVCKSHNNSASNYCPDCGAKMDGVSDG